ncbi:hypothetical protein HK405_015314 [Cladochytrium tenue]|nr:hypothetical protein HK405_015314 [Cladochytrium tenue]
MHVIGFGSSVPPPPLAAAAAPPPVQQAGSSRKGCAVATESDCLKLGALLRGTAALSLPASAGLPSAGGGVFQARAPSPEPQNTTPGLTRLAESSTALDYQQATAAAAAAARRRRRGRPPVEFVRKARADAAPTWTWTSEPPASGDGDGSKSGAGGASGATDSGDASVERGGPLEGVLISRHGSSRLPRPAGGSCDRRRSRREAEGPTASASTTAATGAGTTRPSACATVVVLPFSPTGTLAGGAPAAVAAVLAPTPSAVELLESLGGGGGGGSSKRSVAKPTSKDEDACVTPVSSRKTGGGIGGRVRVGLNGGSPRVHAQAKKSERTDPNAIPGLCLGQIPAQASDPQHLLARLSTPTLRLASVSTRGAEPVDVAVVLSRGPSTLKNGWKGSLAEDPLSRRRAGLTEIARQLQESAAQERLAREAARKQFRQERAEVVCVNRLVSLVEAAITRGKVPPAQSSTSEGEGNSSSVLRQRSMRLKTTEDGVTLAAVEVVLSQLLSGSSGTAVNASQAV